MNELQALIDAIQKLADMELTDETLTEITHNVDSQFSNEIVMQSVNQIVTNLNDQGLTKKEAKEAVETLCSVLNEMVYEGKEYTGNKKVLVDTIMAKVFNIFYQALDKYHSYAIELPIQLEEGAQVPTYAHDSDAAADMYAIEDVEIPAHFKGMPVKTGVHIQLPEGWVAFILPRSSIGAKTPLRLSNSAGVIDSKQEASQWAA